MEIRSYSYIKKLLGDRTYEEFRGYAKTYIPIATIILVGILTFLFGARPLITIMVAGLVGWLICDIDVEKEYTWYSGVWQGIFFVPNFIRHLVWDTPYKAEIYTIGYNIWYWILSILSTISYIFGGRY